MHGKKICQWNSSTTSRQEAELVKLTQHTYVTKGVAASRAVSVSFERAKLLSTAEWLQFFVFALEVCFQLRQSGLRLKALKGQRRGNEGTLKGHNVTSETILRQPVQPVRDPLQHYTGF